MTGMRTVVFLGLFAWLAVGCLHAGLTEATAEKHADHKDYQDHKELRTIEITGMRERFKGRAAFEILEMGMDAHLVHYRGPEKVKFNFNMKYNVLEPAPVYLTTANEKGDRLHNWSLGYCPYWVLYNYTRPMRSALYADEKILLVKRGVRETAIPIYGSTQIEGGPLRKGMCGVIGNYWLFYIMNVRNGEYIDHASLLKKRQGELWMNFNRAGRFARNLVFTAANLKKFRLRLDDFSSNWKPGGFFTVRVKVTDADGEVFDIPRARVVATIMQGKASINVPLEAVFSEDGVPQGYFKGKIPPGQAPPAVEIKADVVALIPNAKTVKRVSGTFKKPQGMTEEIKEPVITLAGLEKKVEPQRDAAGVIRETRAMYEQYRIHTKKDIDRMIERLKKANFNVLLPHHPLYRWDNPPKLPDGTDRLAYIIEKAHEAGLEVHPYGSIAISDDIPAKYRMVDEKGGESPVAVGDVHDPEFRRWSAERLRKLAEKYPIDGINLDHIRTGDIRCYCDNCKNKFRKRFGKDLTEAGVDDWIKWQEEGVGALVEEIYKTAKAAKPRLIVSAWCIDPVQKRGGQRGADWLNKGWLDIVAQGTYWYDTHMRVGVIATEIAKTKDQAGLCPCLGTFIRFYSGDGCDRDPLLLVKEVRLMRRLGASGLFFFNYNDTTPEFMAQRRKHKMLHIREGRMKDSGYKGTQMDALDAGPFKEKAIPHFRKKALYPGGIHK